MRGVAHDGEEKEEFDSVDGQKDDEEKVEAGERDAEHFGGEEEAGAELAIARVEEGKN